MSCTMLMIICCSMHLNDSIIRLFQLQIEQKFTNATQKTPSAEQNKIYWGEGKAYDIQRYFQEYFSYVMAVSFIGGGTRSTRRKPTPCRTSMTNCITYCCIEYTSPGVRTHNVSDENIQSKNYPFILFINNVYCFPSGLILFYFLFEVNYSDILNKELL